MELEFPETMMTKINSLKQTQKNLDGHQNVKHGIHKTCFYPADRGEIRKGLGKKVDDEVTLEKKKVKSVQQIKVKRLRLLQSFKGNSSPLRVDEQSEGLGR